MNARTWKLGQGREIALGATSVVMGVLNVTPDSFSDGGRFTERDAALDQVRRMLGEGASIIDVGGESTRPGASVVDAATEQARVLPLVRDAAREGALVSVDSYRSETARLAVEAGAHIINDVSGLTADVAMADTAAETSAGLVIMHTGRNREKLPDVIDDQLHFLGRAVERARSAGVEADRIVLDPGFGFAKETEDENLELMARFAALHDLGYPMLVGTSRKRFVGSLTGREPAERDVGTAATSVILRLKGAAIFRVHNVAANRDALLFADAMLARGKDHG